jgi:hypothetical protein
MNESDILLKQSDKSSTVGRQIAFGISAAVWGVSLKYNIHNSQLEYLILTNLITLAIYFFVDLNQYFLTTIRYRRIVNDYLRTTKIKDEYDLNFNKLYDKMIDFSYFLFKTKFVILFIAVIELFLFLIFQFFNLPKVN